MNRKTLSLALVGALLLTMTASAEARNRPRLQRMQLLKNLRFGLHMAENNLFEGRMILRMKDEIGLTAEQVKRIENMMLSQEETAIRRQSDLKVMELHFAALLKNDKVNRKEMERMARDIGKFRTDQQIGHLNYLLDIRDTLSAEQIGKLEQLKKKSLQRPGRMMGGDRFAPGPGGPPDGKDLPPGEDTPPPPDDE